MKKLIFAALLSCLLPLSAYAEDLSPSFTEEKLTGDWGGWRDKFYKNGYSFDVYYKFDAWRNFSGGAATGNRSMDNLDIQMTVDGGKAFNSDGTTIMIYLLNNNGGRINDVAGTAGGIDNIETSTHAFKLYEAWVEQAFWDDHASILVGLHDLNSEFYATDTSGLFLNPTYGIGTEMAATGDNGPSIFPTTSLAARLMLKPTENTYIMAGTFDGVPGDPANARGTHIRLADKDGALLVAEGGIKDNSIGHLGVGVWEYTAGRPDQQNAALTKKSKGMYFLIDKSVYKEGDKDISAFARGGFTAGNIEQFRNSWSAGIVLTGFIPGRAEGQLGFAVARAANSSKFKTANAPVDDAETQYELTYADKLKPWLTIQPDLQYTVNPGTTPGLHNAWTAGIRFGVDF